MKKILLIGTVSVVTAFTGAFAYEHQLEFKAGDLLEETILGRGVYAKQAVPVAGYLSLSHTLIPGLSLSFMDEFDGLIKPNLEFNTFVHVTVSGISGYALNRPLSERNIPNQNRGILGLRYVNNIELGLAVEHIFYAGADRIPLMQIPSKDFAGDTANHIFIGPVDPQRQMRTGVIVSATLPIDSFKIGFQGNYIGLSYDHVYGGEAISNGVYEIFAKSPGYDQDLWTQAFVEYRLPIGLTLSALSFIKNNVSGNHIYDLYRYSAGVGGEQVFLTGDNKFTWELAGAFFASPRMDTNNYATGYHGTLYLRDVQTIAQNLFVKAMIALDYGQAGMLKQRYELSVRYTGSSESSTEIGYYNLQGGLFPLQSIFWNNKIKFTQKLYLGANASASWIGPNYNTTFPGDTVHVRDGNLFYPLFTFFNFAKAVGDVEIGFEPVNNLTIFVGGNFTHFVGERTGNNFLNRTSLFLGVRNFFQ